MLHQFSWLQFLLAALILSLIWYSALALFVFRSQLAGLLSGRTRAGARRVAAADYHYDALGDLPLRAEQPEAGADTLMGKPAMPEGMTRLGMHEFSFAGPGAAEVVPEVEKRVPVADRVRTVQQSFIPDVLEELKEIFAVLESEQGSKADFMSLFEMVKGKYPALKAYPDKPLLNEFIRGHVLFPISDRELEELWA